MVWHGHYVDISDDFDTLEVFHGSLHWLALLVPVGCRRWATVQTAAVLAPEVVGL